MSQINKADFMMDLDIISVLQNFLDINTDKLDEKDVLKKVDILNYYLKYPAKTTYDYHKNAVDKHTTEKRTIYRYFEDLVENGFLEPIIENQDMPREMKKNYKKPYRLSLTAIFYVILNNTNISIIELIRGLFENYRENHLFVHFLYPIIREETLNEIEYDISFYTIVVEYLRNVCRDIVFALKWLKNMRKYTSSDGYLMDPVFVWHNNPKDNINQEIIDKILFFLNNTLKWENTDDLRITPNSQENTIEIVDVSNQQKNSRITILKGKNKAFLKQNGLIIHDFSIVSRGESLSIETKSNRKAFDAVKSPFLERYREQLVIFLTKLRTQLIQSTSLYTNPTFETLSEDERYNRALELLERELGLN